MTVGELIKKLQSFNPDSRVDVCYDNESARSSTWFEVRDVRLLPADESIQSGLVKIEVVGFR